MKIICASTILLFFFSAVTAQITIRGKVVDGETGESLFSAAVLEKGTANGINCDYDGNFRLLVNALPVTLVFQYMGYTQQEINVSDASKIISVKMKSEVIESDVVEIVGDRISEKQKQSPLTVESMDLMAIRECPTGNFYEDLGALKGVDLTTASLGFRVINTRGFNSTSPVRSLQLIDGVDNQSPGLNFSLGNFLGCSEMDLKKVDIVAGASSAFYGPGAFNGVIAMETKNPFFFPGIQVSMKVGERSLFEPSARIAQVFRNRDSLDFIAYKLCISYMRANDWEATNYTPIYGATDGAENPGRFDAVNIYGDEFFPANNFTSSPWNFRGIGIFYRTGYKEIDMVDYNTHNMKAAGALHLRTNPKLGYESPELVFATNVSSGTTVYHGENRFALRDIFFMQNRIELRKKDTYFIRVYETHEDAGKSYDPYATSLKLLNEARSNEDWSKVYIKFWNDSIDPLIDDSGYPGLEINPDWIPGDPNSPFYLPYNYDSLAVWNGLYTDSLFLWHSMVEQWTNTGNGNIPSVDPLGYFIPGSPEFDEAFNRITSLKNNQGEGGTRFFDRSALVHAHGEYQWHLKDLDEFRVGFNTRFYLPNSDGTIFSDTISRITNREFGLYTGGEKKLANDRVILGATLRLDKNENFNALITPAASVVYMPLEKHYARFSFSSALRNPTLTDQFLYLNVGPAILSGNLNGADSLITLESFSDYRGTLDPDTVRYFNIDPIEPENVKSFEVGYRASLGRSTFVDASAYYSIYKKFIGYNIGISADFDQQTGLPDNIQAYRYSANSKNTVTTQGASIGLNQYIGKHFLATGNFSWNKLLKTDENDPIIPAFNTPQHKFNIGFSGREFSVDKKSEDILGFSINYKWVQEFLFEGSPQFTGTVPSYDLVDAQVNYIWKKANTTFKLGCSNLLNNRSIQTYGGPEIGRLAYFSVLYELSDF